MSRMNAKSIHETMYDVESTAHGRLKDWEDNIIGIEPDSPQILNARTRKSTSEQIRKHFGKLATEPIQDDELDLVIDEQVKSVSEIIRGRKRTVTLLKGLFGLNP